MNDNYNKIALKATNINKYFLTPVKFHVLKDISFEIYKGEFMTLIGKSGCGKSTLLYTISTMDTNFEGQLSINGTDLTNKTKKQLASFRNSHIGFVFQFHYLLEEFTALKNVMLPALKLNKYSDSEVMDRAYEKLKIMGMESHANKTANKLSGGEQQRIAIARALINEPSVILCDEPTGNLDKKNSEIVQAVFKDLALKNEQTIISVTHDNDFAKGSDRIIEMSDGRLI